MSFGGVIEVGGLDCLVVGCLWNRFDLLLFVVLDLVYSVCFSLILTLGNILVCT